MNSHPGALQLAQSLKSWIRSRETTARDVSQRLGFEAGHLTRAFAGRAPLRLRTVFELLEALDTDPQAFFETHYPLGGDRALLLSRVATSSSKFPQIPSFQDLARSAKNAAPKPTVEELVEQAGLRLLEAVAESGKSQAEISLALGLSESALGQALRGGSELTCHQTFGALAEIGVSPAQYFARVFLLGNARDLEAVALTRALNALEGALEGLVLRTFPEPLRGSGEGES